MADYYDDLIAKVKQEESGENYYDKLIKEVRGIGQVEDIAHPDISTKDRFIVKNFANTPQDAINYLAKKYPEHDIELKGNDIAIKRKDELNFKKLDPSSLELADIGDIGYDVLSGVGETAATGLAGIGTAGWGAIPAGAAASAASETIRQGIGRTLGVNPEVSGTDIAISGAIGGAFPLAGKAVRGAWNFAGKKALPYLGEKVSGVTRQTIKDLGKDFVKITQGQRSETAKEASQNIIGAINKYEKSAMSEAEKITSKAEKPIDISGAEKAFDDSIARAETKFNKMPTEINLKNYEGLQNLKNEFFSGNKELQALDAWDFRKQLDDLAKYRFDKVTSTALLNMDEGAKKEAAIAAREARTSIKEGLDNISGFKNAIDKYKEALEWKTQVKPVLASTKATVKQLSDISKDDVLLGTLKDIQAKTGTDILSAINIMQAQGIFGKTMERPRGMALAREAVPLGLAGAVAGGALGRSVAPDLDIGLGGYESLLIGGALGGAAGAKIGGRAAVRGLTNLLKKGQKKAMQVERLPTAISPWLKTSNIGYGVGTPTMQEWFLNRP
jgi:hypothetical protein